MEPTIYKPSIYKGAGIYKAGAEGGGGGNDYGAVYFGDIYYPYTKIGSLYWTTSNLCFYGNGIQFRGDGNNTPIGKDWGANGGTVFLHGLYYNQKALVRLDEILPEGWRVAKKSDWINLFNEFGGQANCGKKILSKYTPMNGTNESGMNLFTIGYINGSNGTGLNSFVKIATPTNDGTNSESFIFRDGQNQVENNVTQMSNGFTSVRICKDA